MDLWSRLRGAAALAIAGVIGLSAPVTAQQQAAPQRRVDLELLLAVDISQSMDRDEHALQRNGYVEAFRHQDVINALMSGPEGKIAVMYMEWAGDFDPVPTIPWMIIDSAEAAHRFADRLEREPIFGEQRTSISNALLNAQEYIQGNNITSHRQAIDVSGDGANNAGSPIEPVRDAVVKSGIIINGLPIMLGKPMEFYDIPHLDRYYKHCVIGGEGAFIAPVFDLKQLAATIRKKLVLEIAGNDIAPPGTAPVQYAEAPGIARAQLKLPTEKTDCLAGEKAWGGGYGGYGRFPDR